MNYFISSRINRGVNNTNFTEASLREEAKNHIRKNKLYKKGFLRNEDLISNVMTAIWSAASTYNPKFGGSVETRKAAYVEWELIKYRKFCFHESKKLSTKNISEPSYTRIPKIEKMEIVNLIHSDKIKGVLSKDEKRIINMLYLEGLNQTESATKMGETSQYVHRTHKAAIQKIKEQLESIFD